MSDSTMYIVSIFWVRFLMHGLGIEDAWKVNA